MIARDSATRFSPDARYVSVEGDEPLVYDVATGRRVPIDVDGREFAAGYEWLGPDALALVASRSAEHGPFELLTCKASTGACTQVVADLGIGSVDQAEGRVAVPDGIEAR